MLRFLPADEAGHVELALDLNGCVAPAHQLLVDDLEVLLAVGCIEMVVAKLIVPELVLHLLDANLNVHVCEVHRAIQIKSENVSQRVQLLGHVAAALKNHAEPEYVFDELVKPGRI